MATVGICEDDDGLRGILRRALERENFEVFTTSSGADAVRAFSRRPPAVLILDIGLPDSDGRDVCRALRARGVTAPVLFLTARDALPDRLSAFHAGGDDYLAKPFALSELAVRVRALARRGGASAAGAGAAGASPAEATGAGAALGALLDPAMHAINGDPRVALTPTEYRLLAATCAAQGAVVRRAELLAAGWPDGVSVSDNTLDAYVSRIRAKLRQAGRPEELANVRGVGYRLT
jgi:two-component system response regulator MprA